MEEEGISNLYIDGLMEKLVIPFEVHSQLIKFLHLRTKIFPLLLIYREKMKKERILLQYHLQKILLYILIHMELNILI